MNLPVFVGFMASQEMAKQIGQAAYEIQGQKHHAVSRSEVIRARLDAVLRPAKPKVRIRTRTKAA
jgi:hypothetical protein